MRFDWPSDDEFKEAERPADLPMLPEGSHVGTIVQVGESKAKWHCRDGNPDGKCVRLAIEVPGYQQISAEIPIDWRGMVEAACRSARVHPPTSGQDWDEQQLHGKTVTFEAVRALAKTTNREYLRVSKWIAGADPLPAAIKATPKRTPAAKVEAVGQGGSPDDIPF
jgi:hypothetical protein